MNKLKLTVLPAAAAGFVLASATAAVAASTIKVTPSTGLVEGQSVTVSGTGFPASTSVFVLECSSPSKEGCDVARLLTAQTQSDGSFTAKLTVHTGAIGNGTCDATHPCQVIVSDAGNTATALAPIKFAGAAPASPVATSAAATSSPAAVTESANPSSTGAASGNAAVSVEAGSGGEADRDGVPPAAIVLAGLAAVTAVGGGGVCLARRR